MNAGTVFGVSWALEDPQAKYSAGRPIFRVWRGFLYGYECQAYPSGDYFSMSGPRLRKRVKLPQTRHRTRTVLPDVPHG